MKKAILFVVMLSLVAFVSVSIAADAPKAATTAAPAMAKMKFSGAIKSVDSLAKSFVVTDKKGNEQKTFMVDDMTKFVQAKKDLTFADLKAGLKVHVEYKMQMDKAVAGTVRVVTK